jgi:DNA-binding winged helix-turn-helix (wHTH) protein
LNEDRCVLYDLDQERLLVARGAEQHEIQVRAQVHRLVRHMVERNAASGGTPVLCTHAELMEAVWGDEPMHDRTELAKLVWELRRQLETVDAADLIETARSRGYRLRTCPPVGDVATPEDQPELPAVAPGTPPPKRVGRPLWLLLSLLAILVVAGVVVVVLTTRSDGGKRKAGAADVELATFVDRIENVLEQSAAGRREIRAALSAGLNCRITPDEAARRISSVADNRQSILEQLGSLAAPAQTAAQIVTLLQRALQQSIEADRHYRDGFLETQAGSPCPIQSNSGFVLAARSDALATGAKRRFVTAFNPLARQLDRRTWPVESI